MDPAFLILELTATSGNWQCSVKAWRSRLLAVGRLCCERRCCEPGLSCVCLDTMSICVRQAARFSTSSLIVVMDKMLLGWRMAA